MARTEPRLLTDTPIAILAGSGRLPEILSERLTAQGNPPLVLELNGDLARWKPPVRAVHVPPTNPDLAFKTLADAKIRSISLAGGISVRPRLSQFHFGRKFFKYVFALGGALLRGDDGLLKTVVRLFESEGYQVVGAHEIAPDLLAGEGNYSIPLPSQPDEQEILAAFRAARELGARDIGQAAVTRDGQVIALEGRQGTAHMLAELAKATTGVKKPSGVLAKVSKPGQELRVDMPTIGPDTVRQAHLAGLAGIVVEADHALLVDREEIIRQANMLGLFVCGRKVSQNA